MTTSIPKTRHLSYSVLGFDKDENVSLMYFLEPEDLEKAEDWLLDRYIDMELVDAKGGCWRIVSVEKHGPAGSLLSRILSNIFGTQLHRVTIDIEPRGSMTFDTLVERVVHSIQRHADDWYDEEIGAGEGGREPQSGDVQRTYLINRIRQADSTQDICIILTEPFFGLLSDR